MSLGDDRRALVDFVAKGASVSAILGAAVKLAEMHGTDLEKVIARAIDATVQSHLQAAKVSRRDG